MGTLIAVAMALVVALVISGVRLAVRSARRQAREQSYRDVAAAGSPTFETERGETVELRIVARSLGGTRTLPDDVIEDQYPDSYPLVTCTTRRLVVQMALSDRTTDIVGDHPPRRPDLRQRLGAQFAGDERSVSSMAWDWAVFGELMTGRSVTGLSWTDTSGRGGLILTFLGEADRSAFERLALAGIARARAAAGRIPAEGFVTAEPSPTSPAEYGFPDPLIVCASCGTVADEADRFCTGCGAAIHRLGGIAA